MGPDGSSSGGGWEVGRLPQARGRSAGGRPGLRLARGRGRGSLAPGAWREEDVLVPRDRDGLRRCCTRAAGSLVATRALLLWAASLVVAAHAEPREEVVAVRPLIVVVRDFASPEECQRVLELIERCHHRDWPDCQELHSQLHAKGNGTVAGKPRRNSTSFQLQLRGELDSAVDGLVRRSHLLARHPITYGEGVQVASYHPGDYYEFHHDSLSRRATVLLYLTDLAEGDGGETIFPLVRAPGVPADAPAPLPPAVIGRERSGLNFKIESMEPMAPYCESDFYLKVRPEVGKAVLFYSYSPNYALDEYAVHGACPIHRGHKAIFQRWMRFEENSLFQSSAETDEAVRLGRTELGHERLLRPATAAPTGLPPGEVAPAAAEATAAPQAPARQPSKLRQVATAPPELPPRHEI